MKFVSLLLLTAILAYIVGPPEVYSWRRFRVRLPRVRVRLPRVRLPRIRLPRIRLPRIRLPRIRLPRIRIRWPRIRLPRIRIRVPPWIQNVFSSRLCKLPCGALCRKLRCVPKCNVYCHIACSLIGRWVPFVGKRQLEGNRNVDDYRRALSAMTEQHILEVERALQLKRYQYEKDAVKDEQQRQFFDALDQLDEAGEQIDERKLAELVSQMDIGAVEDEQQRQYVDELDRLDEAEEQVNERKLDELVNQSDLDDDKDLDARNLDEVDEDVQASETGINLKKLADGEKALDTSKRGVFDFYNVFKCARPDLSVWKLRGYGCFCGAGGKLTGNPVDGFDNCCKVHDHCYNAARKKCRIPAWRLYVLNYHTYSCCKRHKMCKPISAYAPWDWLKRCRMMKCQCDYQQSQCLRYQTWHRQYKGWSKSKC